MARPPAGPQGNSPRDVRDDAVGVPAENVSAPEPPRWPPKRKKITSNTFHAKVSGSTSGKRADRKAHFRRGGMVKGYARGGSVEEDKPGEQKNDPTSKAAKLQKGGPVAKAGRFQGGGRVDTVGPRAVARAPLRSEFKAGGGAVKKRQAGGGLGYEPRGGWKPPDKPASWPSDLRPVGPPLDIKPPELIGPRELIGPPDKYAKARAEGARAGQKILRDRALERMPRSESTQRARALSRLDEDNKEADQTGGERTRTPEERMEDVREIERAGPQYKDGGPLSAAQRQALPKSDFALPGKGEGPKGAGSGSYPINDPSHARNALARSSGKPEAAQVRRKVMAKYPGMGK